MDNFFNGMLGKIQPGLCRITANGKIAIKTKNGYKTYNAKTGRLTNCANFVFNMGDEFFFVVPTNKLHVGDIILVNGTPRCVINVNDNEIVALNYENSTKEFVVPERHIFFGKEYMYGKIFSPMGNLKGDNLMKYMMMSEMLKGMGATGGSTLGGSDFNPMTMMLFGNMFGSGTDNLFEGMFDFDDADETLPASGDDDETEEDG